MKRPASVTVFGVLNIVFAAIGIVGVIGSLMVFTVLGNSSNNPVVQIIHDNPAYAAWMKIAGGLGLIVSGGLLAAGIGLLLLRPWGRILSIAYSIYSFVMIPLGLVMNFIFLFQPLLARAHEQHGPEAAGAIGGAIGGTFGSCFGLVYPILLLIFMLRPKVVAAFRGQEVSASGQI